MQRPEYISNELIKQYDEVLEKDTLTPEFFKTTPLLREVLYAGFYLMQELEKLGAEEHIIVQMQFTLGTKSFGAASCWEEMEKMLTDYKNGNITFIDEEEVQKEIEAVTTKDVPRDPKTQN